MASADDCTEDEKNWQKIEVFHSLLEKFVISSHIVQDLVPFIGGIDDLNKIKKAEKNSTDDGMIKLLELLKNKKQAGWFQAFIEALRKNDYSKIADHVCAVKKMKKTNIFQALLATYCDPIVSTIDPGEILDHLLQRETITKEDWDDIKREEKNEGKKSGMILLLGRLPHHTNYWFSDFIATLMSTNNTGYKKLARQMVPAISKGSRRNRQEHSEVAEAGSIHHDYEYYKEDLDIRIPLECSNRPDPEGEEWIQDTNERQSSVATAGTADDSSHLFDLNFSSTHYSAQSTASDDTLVKNLLANSENPLLSGPMTMDSNMPLEIINNLSAFATPKERTKEFNANISPCQDKDVAKMGQSQSECWETKLPTSDAKDEEIQAEPLELRSYQRELAEPALNDKNVIIVAPTGSGKTHVALYITENHLDSDDKKKVPGMKVVFLVPTAELVSQQTRMYHTYLSRFEVCGLSGEIQESQKVPLSSLIEKYDIIVMTPQILLNALNKHLVESLKVFTLMVFDECHHTTKEHPYNNIMAVYLDEKCLEHRDYLLPQIVGLTASVGVGNARDVLGAKKHILSLCANLDAVDGISIVEKHKEELEKFVNKPNEEKVETYGRKEDPFQKIICDVMCRIERCIQEHINKQKISKLSQLMVVPSTRGSEPYTQWISRLHREVAKIYDQRIRRPIYACQAHLRIYNTALMINEDCRTADALAYLLKEFKEIDPNHKDDTDNWLEALFNKHKKELECISKDQCYENPKLKKLAKLIMDKYKITPDMRAIVFCKTREMTMALLKWIEQTPELAILSPNRLVGANASAEKGGMTQNKQEDVLTYFKNGKHKVIITSSVAEEGLDVSKCNLVIRYEYVTNEIAMIQARGRGRAEDSDYVVMGDHRRGAAQKEEMNRIRENMMNKAIMKVKQMADEERKKEIQHLQREAMNERKMNEAGKKLGATSCPLEHADDWELRCMKCDEIGCFTSDICLFADSHHAVLDITFKDRIIVEPHPNPKRIDEIMKTDKIFCKRCRHDWGICVIYKSVKVSIIKINNFRVVNISKQTIHTPRKWRDAPFSVPVLTSDKLEQYTMKCLETDN